MDTSIPGPLVTAAVPSPASLRLTGTLRQRGTELYLEQRKPLLSSAGETASSDWTTQREDALLETPATRSAVSNGIDTLVTISGNSDFIQARHHMFVVLESVGPPNAS